MQPELTGYTDRFSVSAGQTIRFMVSTDSPEYQVEIVRLIHADERGPGYKDQPMSSPANRAYPGRKQETHAGSYIRVEHRPALANLSQFTLQAWIYPTTPAKGEPQGIINQWANGAGYALCLGENGDLGLWLDGQRFYTGKPLRDHEWYFVAASFDGQTAHLVQQPLLQFPNDSSAAASGQPMTAPSRSGAPLLIAAAYSETTSQGHVVGKGIFNGKIDRPRIFDRALGQDEIEQAQQGLEVNNPIAAWDFSADISSAKVTDTGGHALHGTAINMPARAVTGWNWDGSEVDFRRAPEQYGAIHFHDDDLEDARWDSDFELTIPSDWKSGIYAAHLTAGDIEDHIPFYIRPQLGKPTAKALVLAPTMTYLAYANFRRIYSLMTEPARDDYSRWLDAYFQEHPELSHSIYDLHSDGSGVAYSTRLRPIIPMRAKYRWGFTDSPRHFSSDLYLPDWMESKGIDYDVATDEDLHFDGLELLRQYKVVLTGTHPEYWTTPMLDALAAYEAGGGRLMYLGGNGFYWVTSVDPERPHIVEVRRGNAGTRAWNSEPGECYHSTTGELGGLWRHRGRAPNRVGGVGFTAQGWAGRAPGYQRQPDSFDPRAAFIFEGIGADDIIGDFGLIFDGAAGDEIDRADRLLGTPAHALVLASSSGHSDAVLPVVEEATEINVQYLTREDWQIRADMVYYELPNGGAVFATGSINWCSSLSHNHYDNNVSRITENVLREFLK
jgi:N,N-dimethylformamidase